MQPRSPVVAILGHVDHGKTSLLDYIRKSQLAAREHGGITQRIGAYEIQTDIKGYSSNKITFIDTPGHEAFSQLRARGATVADIAILIIDAKDSLMPQTVESIAHIKHAQIPYIVALNKIDLPDANPEKVKNDLLKHEVVVEDKGGNVPTVKVSAKTGEGVHELLESILLIAADKNLTYDPAATPQAYIIETKKDKRGIVVSAVIKNGVMKTGDTIYADDKKARIKALINDLGKPVPQITPSTPAEILGFQELPGVGALLTTTVGAEKAQAATVKKAFTLESIIGPKTAPEKQLSLVIKTDSQGSLEAIRQSLEDNQKINIVLTAVGDVHRSDIFLAKTTKAIVVGFNVAVDNEVRELAKQEKVVIKTYNIIYELIEELEEVSDLLREKEQQEKSMKGEAKILATFLIEGEKVFGVKVSKGKVNIGDQVEVYQDGNLIGKTKLVSLKIRAKSVPEVKKDQEAGMVFSPPLDIRVGHVVKFIL